MSLPPSPDTIQSVCLQNLTGPCHALIKPSHPFSHALLRRGICSEKCIIKKSYHCVDTAEYTHTNLDVEATTHVGCMGPLPCMWSSSLRVSLCRRGCIFLPSVWCLPFAHHVLAMLGFFWFFLCMEFLFSLFQKPRCWYSLLPASSAQYPVFSKAYLKGPFSTPLTTIGDFLSTLFLESSYKGQQAMHWRDYL